MYHDGLLKVLICSNKNVDKTYLCIMLKGN